MIEMTAAQYKDFINCRNRQKKAKYRNEKVYVCDSVMYTNKECLKKASKIETYDSKKEYERHIQLKLLEKAGKIKNLQRQVPLVIQEKFDCRGETIAPIIYKADFCYITENNVVIVEDVKGYDKQKCRYITTKDFRLKWKLLKNKYPQYQFVLF